MQVTCTYPGASAKEVADAVAAPIEQQVNGVEGMMYMSSQCANDGTYNLTVTFQQGINLNMAQVLVQNRVNLAVPLLPDVIKQTGVTTLKRSPDILMGLAINSPNGRYDQLYLSNYALMQIKDELARVPGVGDVFLFGQRDYSMRIWVDPGQAGRPRPVRRRRGPGDPRAERPGGDRIDRPGADARPARVPDHAEHPGPADRRRAIREHRPQARPDGRHHAHQGRRPRRAGRQEPGHQRPPRRPATPSSSPSSRCPTPTPWKFTSASSPRWKTSSRSFPKDVDYDIGFDTTPYTRESIHEVVKTLRDAIILVAVVVLLFLQNWRSAIIPLVAVPVAIIGTFAVMAAIGFSLNNLTLFGLVLAIGIVVDDAIVVVEAVEHSHRRRPVAARGDHQGDGAGVRAGDRGGPGAERGVRAVRLHQRHHRPVLPPVRPDDRRLDDHLGVQLADAEPGA